MSFVDPVFLLGLAAGSIPILIHLINRRRARRHRFAAMDILLRSDRRTARRFRLRQLVLLIIRTLAIAAVPFALARPYASTEIDGVAATGGAPRSTVIVVDDSMSMGWGEEGERLLDKAVNQARKVVAALRDEDNVALVLAGSPTRAPVGELTFDRDSVHAALDKLEAGHRSTDLAGALTMAAGILGGSTMESQRIILISDLQGAGFDPSRMGFLPSNGPPVVVIDVAPPAGRANRAVLGVTAVPAPEDGPKAWRVEAEVANYGPDAAVDVPISVSFGDRVLARGFATAKAGETVTKSFSVRLDGAGVARGRVELAPDLLPADDGRDISVRLQRTLTILVVNGDPRTIPFEDEVFYLEKALLPGAGMGSRLRPRIIDPGDLPRTRLGDFDVILLANVGEVPDGAARLLVEWVRGGGGLLITGGSHVTPESTAWLRDVLPGVIRGTKALGAGAGEPPVRLGPLPPGLPLFEIFLGEGGEGLRTATFHSYLLVQPSLRADRRVLLSFDNGAPALLERTVEDGRALLLTTTVDRAWTNLPTSTGFLPLIQEICHHLARSPRRSATRTVIAGTPAAFPVPTGAETGRLTPPEGRAKPLTKADVEGRADLLITGNLSPGIHTVAFFDAAGAALGEEDLVIAPDPRESDVRAMPATHRAALTGSPDEAAKSATPSAEQRTDFWPWAFLLLMALLLFEAVLVIKRRRPLEDAIPLLARSRLRS